MAPRTTIWPLDEHTKGKHLVLEGYLKAWLPILGQTQGRIAFIDAFAGPGLYSRGEPGSPIIAIRALRDHAARGRFKSEVVMLFVEADQERFDVLEKEVERERVGLPSGVTIKTRCSRFDKEVSGILNEVDDNKSQLAPCFMMVDPFGVSGTPMSVIRRFLQQPKSEVLVTFMVDFIDRFDEGTEFPPHLDELFGTTEWTLARDLPSKDARREFFFELYRRELKLGGAENVVRFDLWDQNRLVYALFHASKHWKACDRMKEAIWKADPSGEFAFRASREGQLGLVLSANLAPLQQVISAFCAEKGWVSKEELIELVASDSTDYYSGQLRQGALIPMEREKLIEVKVEGKRIKETYPDRRTKIRILR